jgi:4-hydroxythreonine-4-phosphate dehydrogenase
LLCFKISFEPERHEYMAKAVSFQDSRPKIAIVMGDATGIGPELVAKSLANEETYRLCRPVVIGDARVMRGALDLTQAPLTMIPLKSWSEVSGKPGQMEIFDLGNLDPRDYRMGEVNPRVGRSCLEHLEFAIKGIMARKAAGLVFAPLNKGAMHLGGSPFAEELKFFAHLTRAAQTGEINVLEPLWTSRVTSHIGLREVPANLSLEGILRAIDLLDRTMRRAGIQEPKIAVTALNPHGGEKGLFGPEEGAIIRPAVEKANQEGRKILGPYPADTIFVRARKGEFSGIVTMYHDQGQVAMKLLGFDRGVTVAGGLPIVVTTPAHGTAHDIAGKGIADPGAFQSALRLAVRMANSPEKE